MPMTVADMTPFQLYSVIMAALVVVFLSRFIWQAHKESWTDLSFVQKGMFVVAVFMIYGAPTIIGFRVMAPT